MSHMSYTDSLQKKMSFVLAQNCFSYTKCNPSKSICQDNLACREYFSRHAFDFLSAPLKRLFFVGLYPGHLDMPHHWTSVMFHIRSSDWISVRSSDLLCFRLCFRLCFMCPKAILNSKIFFWSTFNLRAIC